MCRTLLILRVCCCTWCALGSVALLRGEEPADEQLQKLSDESRSRAEGVEVSVALGDRTAKAQVRPDPLMKYTDPPRRIRMATLWVWLDEGCPVALGKVEAYPGEGGPRWLYCFSSTSTGLVDGKWPDGHHFRASKPGVEWVALDGPAPHETAAGRVRQMKDLFRRFSTHVVDEGYATSEALRPLARPLYEYSSPKKGVLQGVLCGFTANGTNPDVIIALEAVDAAKGDGAAKPWRYGVVPMTATAVSVKLDKAEVFKRRFVGRPGDQETWTWFWGGPPRR